MRRNPERHAAVELPSADKAPRATVSSREAQAEKQPSRHEYLQRFADRLPGGKRGVAALTALAVGLFPLGRELLYRTQRETEETSVRGSSADQAKAASLLAELGRHELTVETGGESVRVVFDGADGANAQTVDVQPDPVQAHIDTGFLWGMRDYSRAQEVPNEQEVLRDQVRAFLQDYFDQHGALGKDAREAITSVKVDISAFASPEGATQKNQELSELRAKQSEAVVREVLEEYGIDREMAEVSVRGMGEEAGFEGFVQALADAGVELTPRAGITQEHMAEQIIRDIHDGKVTDQRMLDAYQEHIASQRHVVTDIAIETAPVQVVITDTVPGTGSGSETKIPGMEASANSQWALAHLREVCVANGIDPDVTNRISTEELVGIVKEYGRVQEPLKSLIRALQRQDDMAGGGKTTEGKTGRTGNTDGPPPPPPPPPPRLRNKTISAYFKDYETRPIVTGGQTGVGVGSVGGFQKRPSIGRGEHRSGSEPRGTASRPRRSHTGQR